MHCMYCGMPKGTCWAEVMPNSEKKSAHSLTLAFIKLRLSESISQAISQSVS